MNQILKQIATGVAGSIATLVLVAIWGWTSGGGLVDLLGGLTENRFDGEMEKVHMQMTKANQKIQEVEDQMPTFYPRGAVIAFDRDDLNVDLCPNGWVPFKKPGHVVVGAGDAAPYLFREQGGAEMHKLTLDEMPKHEHPIKEYEWGHTINGNGHSRRIDVDDGPPWSGITGQLVASSRGGGKAHNNMPPYIALYLCKKR